MTAIVSTELIVGMEVHVELATRSKMFSRAANPACPGFADPEPNTCIDPTVLALPGSLPVMNADAVESAMLVGLALGCSIPPESRWDRKSYTYPDLPKGYQISQYQQPLCAGGSFGVYPESAQGLIDFAAEPTTIRIERAHLEEDAGKLLHEAPGGTPIDFSIVDYNRAGTPLLEIVTRPDFHSADQAVAFARQLRLLCLHLGVTEGIMQKGHMRFEPNINVKLTLADGRDIFTPIIEIKNLNSFRALRAAIEYEAAAQPKRWQNDVLERASGTKQTRGWDETQARTFVQREKEEAHDYRYFPDPDLPPVVVDHAWRQSVAQRIVELPVRRLARLIKDFELEPKGAMSLVEQPTLCAFMDEAIEHATDLGITQPAAGKGVGNLLLQTAARLANECNTRPDRLGVSPAQLAKILHLRLEGSINSNAVDQLFAQLASPEYAGHDPAALAETQGMLLIRDDAAIDTWIEQVLAANQPIVEQIRSGKTQAIGRLIGETMKLSGGAADAADIRRRLLERIGADA